MKPKILTLILFFSVILHITGLDNNHNINFKCNVVNSSVIRKEENTVNKKSKKLEKISFFISELTTFASLTSNDMIAMIESGENVDTIELADKNSKLFTELKKLFETAKIDSTLLVEPVRIDSLYDDVLVRNDASGYIITDKILTYTIPTTDSEYEELKNGIYKDIALNETSIKRQLALVVVQKGKNDICANKMILYQYSDGIPNDTICFGTTNTVRVNSYVATVDSLLLETVRDSLVNFIIYK